MRAIASLALATLLCLSAATANAQSQFGLQLDLGGDIALGPTVRSVVSLDTVADSGDESVGIPRLSDRRNRVGLHGGLTAHIGSLAVAYRFERFSWNGARVQCIGDRDARQLPNGEIEDAEVRYDCDGPREIITYPSEDQRALSMHHLIIGPRFYLRQRPRLLTASGDELPEEKRRPARVYGTAGGGATIAQYDEPSLGRTSRFGFNLGGGGGVEVPIDRRLSVGVEFRYMLSMISVPASSSASAGRAVATERNVLVALMDPIHRATLNFSFRFDFR
ncbi:MAG: hypothetical protein ACJAYU_005143 [Bradymonadia bacterium]|jgi:hypothetical protein